MIPLGVLAGRRAVVAPSFITDTFTRADNASSLGTTETGGQTWATVGATWGISSNQAYVSSFTSRAAATVEVGSTSMRLAARVYASAISTYPFLVAGYVDIDNTYQLVNNGDRRLQLTCRVSGTNTAIYDGGSSSLASGDLIEVQLVQSGGTQITVKRNGSTVYTGTDSTSGRPLGTRAGIALPADTLGCRWDDFEAEAL